MRPFLFGVQTIFVVLASSMPGRAFRCFQKSKRHAVLYIPIILSKAKDLHGSGSGNFRLEVCLALSLCLVLSLPGQWCGSNQIAFQPAIELDVHITIGSGNI